MYRHIGFNEFSIETNNISLANSLIGHTKFNEENVEVFITINLVNKKGIVRGIPLNLDTNLLRKEINCGGLRINKIMRLKRKLKKEGEEFTWEDSTTVLVEFVSTHLSSNIFFRYCSYRVSEFIPEVKLCNKCYRYNHISEFRKSSPRCCRCDGEPHGVNVNTCPNISQPKCLSCKGIGYLRERSVMHLLYNLKSMLLNVEKMCL